MTMNRALVAALACLAGAAPAAAAADDVSAAASSPRVEQMVVFRSGKAQLDSVRVKGTTARVGSRKCAVGRGTALAALLRSGVAKVGLRDYGSCSGRAVDSSGLFVRQLGPDANRGQSGWVYKVGRKAASAGAADSTGPFGRGPIKDGSRVTWFYCLVASKCQPTLEVKVAPAAGAVSVRVTAYDDRGKGKPAAGATVHAGPLTATTDSSGLATVTTGRGGFDVYAEGAGAVRSFPRRVSVD
jgi:hypothetical protein